MDKVIYFQNKDPKTDICSGQIYFDFLDYAFDNANYFMLVYINRSGKGYTQKQKYFKDMLKKYSVKSRSNPSWPGIYEMLRPNSTCKIVFYKATEDAKEILKEVSCLSDWSGCNPEYLAFFKGNQCWFYSIGSLNVAAIIHANDEDISFLESKGLASKKNASIPKDNYYDQYDEHLE